MKKIILTALTVLMMFGLIGCSGDLHDFVDPPSIKGDWYYIDIPTDQKNIIFNCGMDTVQTDDIKNIDVSTGSVYYIFDVTLDKGAPGQCKVSDRTDNPESKAGRVWVYSNVSSSDKYSKIYCHNWGGANESKWPGDLATKQGETPVVIPDPFLLTGFVVTTDALGPKPTIDGILLSAETDDANNATYKVRFKATATEHTFAITDVEENVKYTSDKAIELKKSVDLKAAGEKVKPTKITGLTAEGKYEITITTTPAGKVSVVVEEAPIEVTGAKITVSGLPSALNGKTLYFTGDFNGWTKPGEKGSIEAKVTDEGVISITLPDFEYKIADGGKSFSGKFASAGWTKPEIIAEKTDENTDGNVAFKLTETKKTVKGTYKSVSDDVYVCDWVVE